MAEITNPYRPGEPVTDPAMLFGRQDAADWIELQVKGGNQTLALSASPLIGKTSLVRHVAVLQSMNAINMVVSPVALSPAETNGSADEALKPTLNAVLDSVIDQLVPPLSHLRLIDLQTKADAAQAAATLRELFGQVSQHLQPGQHLLLYVDDLHKLVDDDMALVASF